MLLYNFHFHFVYYFHSFQVSLSCPPVYEKVMGFFSFSVSLNSVHERQQKHTETATKQPQKSRNRNKVSHSIHSKSLELTPIQTTSFNYNHQVSCLSLFCVSLLFLCLVVACNATLLSSESGRPTTSTELI